MDPAFAVVLVGVMSGLSAISASFITSRVAGRANRNSTMLDWAKQLQSSEQAARKEASESRDRADRIKEEADSDVEEIRGELEGLRNDLRTARTMVAEMTDKMAMVQAEVWRPEPNVDAIRRLLGRPHPGGVNNH